MDEALNVLEDCLKAGDNPERALADVASDYEVDAAKLAAAFLKKFGKSYLNYGQN